jgi:hypothetical protein
MTDETKPTKEETLGELRRKIKELESEVAVKDSKIDAMEKREEGYLVWTKNPAYDGLTAGITFTDGMAFIRKDRTFPGYGNGTSEYYVKYLKDDFGYNYQFFTKDQMDELNSRLSDRTRERKEVESRIGTQADMLEKLLVAHQL